MTKLPATCPRCRGTMLPVQRDLYGEYRSCLMCGYVIDREEGPPIDREPQRLHLPARGG